MSIITSIDIINYMPSIVKYSGYERDNTKFDKYIIEAEKNLKRLLKSDNIDVDVDIDLSDENLKHLYLSYLVYKFYHENSYNIEADRPMIEDLLAIYNENYRLLLKSFRKQVYDIVTAFIG